MSKVRCKVTSYRLPFPPATNLYALVFSPPLTNRDASPTLSRGDIFSPPLRIDRKLNFHSALHVVAPSFPHTKMRTLLFCRSGLFSNSHFVAERERTKKSPNLFLRRGGGRGRKGLPFLVVKAATRSHLEETNREKKRRSMPRFFLLFLFGKVTPLGLSVFPPSRGECRHRSSSPPSDARRVPCPYLTPLPPPHLRNF